MFSKYKRKILFSVALGALVFLAFSIYADFNKLFSAFAVFNWAFLPLILMLSLGNYSVRFLKWQYYLRILNIKVPFKLSLSTFISAFTLSITPGKFGEVIKSYLLKEEVGTPVSKSAPIVLAERLTDFISIVILCFIGAVIFDYGKEIIIISGVVFIAFTVLLSIRKLFLRFIGMFENLKFIKKHSLKIHSAYDSIYSMIKLKPFIITLLISIISWFLECAGFYFVLYGFVDSTGVEANLLVAIFIYAFSTLIGAIALLPGGLGATEASLTGLLIMTNVSRDISVASSMIIRVATLWFAVILGIFGIIYFQKVTNKKISNLD